MIYSSQNGQGKTSEWTIQGLQGGNGGWMHGPWAGGTKCEAREWEEGLECCPSKKKERRLLKRWRAPLFRAKSTHSLSTSLYRPKIDGGELLETRELEEGTSHAWEGRLERRKVLAGALIIFYSYRGSSSISLSLSHILM